MLYWKFENYKNFAMIISYFTSNVYGVTKLNSSNTGQTDLMEWTYPKNILFYFPNKSYEQEILKNILSS